jgi:hypothetical protein
MRTHLLTGAVLLLVSGLIAAGCGDDDDETTTTAATTTEAGATGTEGVALSDDEIVDEVNALCESAEGEVADAVSGLDPSNPDDYQAVSDAIAPIGQAHVDAVRAIPGVSENAEVTAYVDAFQEEVDEVEADPSVIGEPDFGEGSDAAADAAGLDGCS